jgi:exosome complex RNA-binding protein Rrp42 (RNase PH superfamily)
MVNPSDAIDFSWCFYKNTLQKGISVKRTDGRGPEALRPVRIARNHLKHAEGLPILFDMIVIV